MSFLQFRQFFAEAVDHGQVQGTEILIEWHVYEFIVDVEEEGVLEVLGRLYVGHPE